MKKLFLLCCAALLALPLAAITARISTSPARPAAGEVFMLNITVDSPRQFSLRVPDMPEGFRLNNAISNTSSSTRIINGKRTVTAVYGIYAMAEKGGEYTIAPLELDFNGEKVTTNALELTVLSPDSLPPSDRFSASLTIHPRDEVYVGELLRADVEIYLPPDQGLTKMPVFTPENFGGGIFLPRDNNGNTFILSADPARRGKGTVYQFSAIFQPRKSGTYFPECRIMLESGRTSYWGNAGISRRTVTAASGKSFTVRPMPPLPAGTIATGLIGKWQISGGISKALFTAGETGEIILQFRGDTPALLFEPPALTLTGCRTFPPEVEKNDGKTEFTVKYPFVALKGGDFTVDLPLAVFEPENGTYRTAQVTLKYSVTGKDQPAADTIDAPRTPDAPENPPAAENPLHDFRRWIIPALLLIITGTLITLLIKVTSRKDPEKTILRRKVRQLARNVKASGISALDTSALDTIARAVGADNGADFRDIAEYIEDEECAEFFRQLSDHAFIPGQLLPEMSDEMRKKVINFIRNLQ
jgi:hypothetical protein